VGRDDVVRLLVEPEEVHSRDEDGFRRLEETARSKMVFAGLKKPQDRADLIAYLKDSTK